jgi:crotonobetainyl-CoA:carnitine CoA-transferase CaiB-like acyl-CoA transferase
LIQRSGIIRTIGARSTRWIWECRDGYVFWSYMGGKPGSQGNRAISKWIDDEGMENPLHSVSNWEEFDMAAQDVSKEVLDMHQKAIAELFMRHTKKEITEEGLKRGLNACVINTPADILENPQLKARNYWVNLKDSGCGQAYRYPKFFFLSNETENFVRSAAPILGEYNSDLYRNELKLSEQEIKELTTANVI